jgi:hypothetical protein
MYDNVLFQRYRITGGIKQLGMHNRSENGSGAWVSLCGHTTHTDTEMKKTFGMMVYPIQCTFPVFFTVRDC